MKFLKTKTTKKQPIFKNNLEYWNCMTNCKNAINIFFHLHTSPIKEVDFRVDRNIENIIV